MKPDVPLCIICHGDRALCRGVHYPKTWGRPKGHDCPLCKGAKTGACATAKPNRTTLPKRTRLSVLRDAHGICHYCNEPLAPHSATIDHVIPRSHGGSNTPNNLVVACKECNRDRCRTYRRPHQRRSS